MSQTKTRKIMFSRRDLIKTINEKSANVIMKRAAQILSAVPRQTRNPFGVVNTYNIEDMISHYDTESKNGSKNKRRLELAEMLKVVKAKIERSNNNEI